MKYVLISMDTSFWQWNLPVSLTVRLLVGWLFGRRSVDLSVIILSFTSHAPIEALFYIGNLNKKI